MKYKKFAHHILLSVTILAGAAIQACSDEGMPDIPDYTRSGEPVQLTVALSLPEMDVQSRADLNQVLLNRVENVWVRTYSADTHKATSEWVKITPVTPTTDTEIARSVTIESQSGRSYIVAVANVGNNGVTRQDLTPQPLSTLLESADTWEQFLDIAVMAPSTPDYVRAPRTPLVMVGCYSDLVVGGNHPEPTNIANWQTGDFQPYFIPAKNGIVDFTGRGAIHLRRIVSHLNFRVVPGDDVNVTVNSYQVMNAPRYSWLYERPTTGGMLANFGDQATSSQNAADIYYADIPQYGAQYISVDNDTHVSTFDFWQAENKHTGTADSYKTRDAYTGTDPVLFTSLTGDTWTSNNEASYVLVSCSVEYKDHLYVDQYGNSIVDGEEVRRTGEATYLIHLGYIDNVPTDFNCFRNVNYTYTLTVNGVNDIRLEAIALDEYNGEEGLVVDLSQSTIYIDAHYAAFNIALSENELSAPDFGFMIIAYENGNQYMITDANDQRQVGDTKIVYTSEKTPEGEQITGDVIDPKYYNWIELRPTTGQNVLAQYKPRYGDNADGSTFLLTDLKGGWSNMTNNMKSNSGYYTVFVNEFTYEPMYTGKDGYADEQWNGQGNPVWMSYVNENPRRFYIRTTQNVSPDGNSIYARSKYGISQQSMMTYYSDYIYTPENGEVPAGTAIGVERENENEGMNLRHTYAGGSSTANGRWNTGMYLDNTTNENATLSINSGNEDTRPQWATYINYATPMQVGAVTNTLRLQGGPEIPARTIANENPHKLPGLQSVNSAYTPFDPQQNDNYTIEAINACMSRNRDNNGNGRIEPDELRWYVPAMDQYLAMMLGGASMPDPMMDYEQVTRLPYVNNKTWNATTGSIINEFYPRYMYVSSNNSVGDRPNVMWVMEGTSTSMYDKISGWAGLDAGQIRPWQIRCIRNLGANLSTVTSDDKVSKPYVHDEVNHKFIMTYYEGASVRPTPYSGNGTGGDQMPVHTIPTDYNSVYYAFEYDTRNRTIPTDDSPDNANETQFFNTYGRIETYINSNPCGDFEDLSGSGWRLPNQEELTIMRNAGLITGAANGEWVSCTVNYFNHRTGVGSLTETSDRYFLAVSPAQGNQLNRNNYGLSSNTVYFRCVRDVEPN